jgi:hypothetical protein
MRVYGASPLYNYVELVFRSKRLFIVSVVLATLIVSTLASLRAGMYSARAMVLLTGTAATGMTQTDDSQLGSVRYKVNLLSIFLANPEFMKTAIRNAIKEQTNQIEHHVWPDTEPPQPIEYHFKTNMSEVAFDKFCKDARQSLAWQHGEGILELSCRWEDPVAADIINAFYWAYHDEVVSHETINSSENASLLKKLLGEYTVREQAIEKKVIVYKNKNVDKPIDSPDNMSNSYVQMLNGLVEMKMSIKTAQEQRDTYVQQLKSIPAKIVEQTIEGSPTSNPIYTTALQKKNDAQQTVDSLKLKYQDSHPKVREAQAALDAANEALAKAEKTSQKSSNLQSKTNIVNPDYVRTVAIINQANAQLKGMQATYDFKSKQAQEEKAKALTMGTRNYEFKWLTDEYGVVSNIRSNLENRLHMAELTERQDELRSSAETAMVVKPVSEPESSGTKSLLLYAAGPILGIVIAFAFSLVAETLDHSLRTPIEVEKHLGKPVLAVLPRMDPPRTSRRQLGSGSDRSQGQATLPPV